MGNRPGHRRFGNVRQLQSGRWQARYRGADGRVRNAPETFARKGDAERYLALVEAQLLRNEWTDPKRAQIRLGDYAERWIKQRPALRPRTVQLYSWLLHRYITPHLGTVPLGRLTTPMIREWRTALLDNGISETMAAKAYRLLRAVLMTAVKEDEILAKNPCRIPGADNEKPAERPVLTAGQVLALADVVPHRFRAMILVTTFGCLRWGEVTALQRQDIDPDAGTVRVRHAFVEQRGVGLVLGPPKSRAGRRTVALPGAIAPAVRDHLAEFVSSDPDAWVFTGPTGRPILRGNFNKLVKWREAVDNIGAPLLHFHDLRHTGNTLAARTGASLRDLMARMGHDSAHAAMIYQHATSEADRAIAEAVDAALHTSQARARGAGRPSTGPSQGERPAGNPDPLMAQEWHEP